MKPNKEEEVAQLKTTAKRGLVVLILVAVVSTLTVILGVRLSKNAEKWATMRANKHLTSDGSFIAAGNITDRNGEVLAETVDGERVYNNSERIRRSTLHIVGDSEGYIASGVQTAYKRELIGYSRITGLFSLVDNGRGNDVKLTLDSTVCAAAYDALNGRKGVVAAYNYKTGELLCSVSSPNYDIRNKPDSEEIENDEDGEYTGVYMNRLIDGLYTPGSVFKIITTACAIENKSDISSWEYTCTGETYINGVSVTCPHRHGKLDFTSAFACSCNGAYAELAVELGKDKLTATAKEFGFGKSFAFGNSFTEASIFDLSNTESSDVAWAGVGQYTTLVNPYHMLTCLGAIANGGVAVMPYAVSEVTSPKGKTLIKTEPESESYIDESTAQVLSAMMRNNVETEYGDYNFKGLSMCGKTGTAEVGDDKQPHAWFMGFSQDEDCPVAIVVVIENGGWGSSNAVPVASAVMKAVSKALA